MRAQNTLLMAALVVSPMTAVVAQVSEPTPAPVFNSEACDAVFEHLETAAASITPPAHFDNEIFEDAAVSYMAGEFYNTADPCELPVITDAAIAEPFSSWASAYTSYLREHHTLLRAIYEGCQGWPFLEQAYPVSHYCSDIALAVTSGLGGPEPTATPTPTPTGARSDDGAEDNEDDDDEEGDQVEDTDNSDDGDGNGDDDDDGDGDGDSDTGSGSDVSGDDDDAQDNKDDESDSSNDGDSAANSNTVVSLLATSVVALACIAVAY
ncbi:hypothetical protein ACRALDRAFT_1066303 [Sodiomyces alcalophilus JCM 7366]|uniref:uncharacterized protein n=1 Tax=Sodiomyces alcalophilus JCM 7366 TaxID=591952 RepID=UPI0039B5D4CD